MDACLLCSSAWLRPYSLFLMSCMDRNCNGAATGVRNTWSYLYELLVAWAAIGTPWRCLVAPPICGLIRKLLLPCGGCQTCRWQGEDHLANVLDLGDFLVQLHHVLVRLTQGLTQASQSTWQCHWAECEFPALCPVEPPKGGTKPCPPARSSAPARNTAVK